MNENEELNLDELEPLEIESDEEGLDLGSLAVGAVLGMSGFLIGKTLVEYAAETIRVKMYKNQGLDVQRGDRLFKTNIGGEIMWMRIGQRDGIETIEFIKPQEETEDEEQNDDPTEK